MEMRLKEECLSLLRSIWLTSAMPDSLIPALLSALPEPCVWPGFKQRLMQLWVQPYNDLLGDRRFKH